ncbi:aminotransferase class V-fold PLP-dependent enzyme [Microbulbifer sp. OS29]|uniref:Aminotransferase class V-fold PLP-dependent enzyme n=1 Tax=Microbulbifer okhotskensis TaxID=2926617 RepID=A0A9X2EQW5_9GAMM|nr:aminotransferase class V-fold PLP-dependent enzyme [Microbulbifer okhotskensis]MCO1334073.1 aminotransferase class V-fold PLP-dependent enzyme [Microbulbifer okhotskensis]
MYKKFYSEFLQAPSGSPSSMLHMACHSHHYWPDVTLDAVQQYWRDASLLADEKWGPIFEEKIPSWQAAVAKSLNLPSADLIAIAPNTHELVYRLISAFDPSQPLHILTTDGEFYSFTRQLQRLEEIPQVKVTRIPREPYATLAERFETELHRNQYQLAYASLVFFDSGVVFPRLLEIAEQKPKTTQFVIDGYHGYFARPIDLAAVANKIFFTAGSYKYFGAGEGLCFMSIPADCPLRPLNTGWFAEMAELENRSDEVSYSNNWLRFAGATMDYSTLYKALAIFDLFAREGITIDKIHRYILRAQTRFLQSMDKSNHPVLNRNNLVCHDLEYGHGHFFTFDCSQPELSQRIQEALKARAVLCDRRQQYLRLGFAIYHDENETYQQVFSS